MTAAKNLNLRAGLLSVLIFLTLLGIWYVATSSSGASGGTAGMTAEQMEEEHGNSGSTRADVLALYPQ